MNVRAIDLPALREEAIEDAGRYAVQRYITGMRSLDGVPPRSLETTARSLAADQFQALRAAELFHVDPGMLALAAEAGKTLDVADLYPEDLPSFSGFVYLGDVPFWGESPVCAASWRTLRVGRDPALIITWFISGDEMRRLAPEQPELADQRISRVNQHLFTLWGFGTAGTITQASAPVTLASLPEGRAVATLFSVWHIMRQTLVTVTDARYDRASIRRLRRQGREPERVRVIALRRRSVSDAGGHSEREYHHQWLVRGHWRQQWYASQQRHRPVWIAPHVKGPDGAPLLGGQKVYSLQR